MENTVPNTDMDINDGQNSVTSFVLNEYEIMNGPEGTQSNNSDSTYRNADGKDSPTTISIMTTGQTSCTTATTTTTSSENTGEQGTKNVSPRTPFIRICPPVNCKEKIVICLDLNEEMESTCFRSRAGDKYSSLDLAKRAIKMFVMHKNQINPAHEFAFVIFHEESTMIQNFSSRPEDILQTLDDSEMITQKSGPLDLDHLYQTVAANVELPNLSENPQVNPPPYCTRVWLIYGRSQSIPIGQGKEAQRKLESSPCFFTDVLYIHEPVGEEGNTCEEIFNRLCELDPIGLSYILEASKYTPIFNSAAKLLAHPLQRPLQDQAAYKIGSLPTVQDIDREQNIQTDDLSLRH